MIHGLNELSINVFPCDVHGMSELFAIVFPSFIPDMNELFVDVCPSNLKYSEDLMSYSGKHGLNGQNSLGLESD